MITDRLLKASADNPVDLTMELKARVKKVKLLIKPMIIPNGLFLLPDSDPDRTIGSIGSIQGERMVTIPPKKANSVRISIILN